MVLKILRWLGFALILLVVLSVSACAVLTDARYVVFPAPARLPPSAVAAEPGLLGPGYGQAAIHSAEAWQDQRSTALLALFKSEIYGALPVDGSVRIEAVEVVDEAALSGSGRLERWHVALDHGSDMFALDLALLLPMDTDGPVPVFLVPNECGNRYALQTDALPAATAHTMSWCQSNTDGWQGALAAAIFGDYVLSPPAGRLLERGYGLAVYHESQLVPDEANAAEPILRALTPPGTPDGQRTGTLAAWAWGLSHITRALKSDPRIGAVAVMGHSRRGKAVLLAGAIEPEIDLIISHQSGSGGGALSRNITGESIGDVTQAYPHWFAPAFAGYAGRPEALPVDQHQLIALIAPRPVLLGNAARDRWSDPAGTLLAANGAGPAWGLYAEPVFEQTRLDRFDPQKPLAYSMRGGTHGVTGQDWETFLDFADAQLGDGPP